MHINRRTLIGVSGDPEFMEASAPEAQRSGDRTFGGGTVSRLIIGLTVGLAAVLAIPPTVHAQVPVVLVCQDGSTRPGSSRDACKNQDGIDWRATERWWNMRAGRYASGDTVMCKDGQPAAAAAKACASQRGLDTASTIAAIQRQTKAGKDKAPSDRAAGADRAKTDSTKWGYPTDREADVQNPAGYRGMERPADLVDADSAAGDSVARGNATSRINQRERQDSLAKPDQNPPGYRGMERPAGLDSARADTAQGSPSEKQ